MKNTILLLGFILLAQMFQAQTTATISAKESGEIIFMMEEEKLARDVYLTLGKKWNSTVFSHISSAEQRHLDKLKAVAELYGLEIPSSVVKDERGKFNDKTLQKLYTELTSEGNISLEKALRVGAKIEELDIKDLKAAIDKSENTEVKNIYTQLYKASENHLRSFNTNLKKEGVTYQPVILSPSDFDGIINAKASCGSGEKGKAGACCSSKKGQAKNASAGCGGGQKGKNAKAGGCCKAKS